MKRLLLLLTILGMAVFSYGQSYNFRHYQVEQGLSYNSVISSLQDKKGFLWFGTKDGLNRFDGYNFKIFRNDPDQPASIGSNFIHSLFEDQKETLWVGTMRGLFKYNRLTETFTLIPYTKNKDIRDIKGDHQGNIWYIAGSVLCSYNIHSKKTASYDQMSPKRATSILITAEDELWVGTNDGFIQHFNQQRHVLENYNVFDHSLPAISNWIEKIYDTGKGLFLIGTSNQGIKSFDVNTHTYKDILTSNSSDQTEIYARDFVEIGNNEYWIATESGLFIYNLKTGVVQHVRHQNNNPYSISDNSIYTLTMDKEGGIWAGTYFGGINYYPKQFTHFNKYFPQGGNSLSGYAVREIRSDKNENLWMGTEDAGLNFLNTKTGEFKHFLPEGTKTSVSNSNIHGLLVVDNELWIGTFEHGLDVMDINTSKVIRHYSAGVNPNALKSNFIESLLQTHNGAILIGTSAGLYQYNKKTDDFTLRNEVPGNLHYASLLEDSRGNVWAGTLHDGLYYFNPVSKTSGYYKNEVNDKNSLISNDINSVFQDSKGNIWVTTESGLCVLNDKEQNFKRYNSKNKFPGSVFYEMLEDKKANLWISTSGGLVCFNPAKNTLNTFVKSNGLLSDQFNYKSAFMDNKGEMFFGSVKGLISFRPSEFTVNQFIAPIYITGFQIYNKEIQINPNGSPLVQSINYTKSLILNNAEATFSIDFAALGYTSPQRTEYKYKMEGLDKHWTYLEKNRKVYFTNLLPGTYIFRVKAANSSGNWKGQETSIRIVINPPFWRTNFAFMAYLLILAAGIYYAFRYYHERSQLKNKRRIDLWESKKEKELYQAKIEFFTNVTHEIRTPLTLIHGPLEEIMRKPDDAVAVAENLEVMKKNADRLIELTDQLLDFRKAEVKGFSLNFVNVNISKVLEENYLRYKSALAFNKLTLNLSLPEIPLYAYADVEALNKMLSNLIDNGLKYADTHFSICLYANETDFTIEFKNDGNIVPVSLHQKLFEPFYRMESSRDEKGTGIGLPLARSLAELHEGTLTILNENEQWNIFLLTLPMHHEREFNINNYDSGTEEEPGVIQNSNSDQPVILLAEDNMEVRKFTARQLSADFTVIQVQNGEEAMAMLQEKSIHLIISDIMMPVMDGFELCKRVKDNLDYTHIPIILLTASNNMQSKIEGLEVGADAYIEKPFSPAHLHKQVFNLLASRDKIKNYFAHSPLVHIKSMAYNKADEVFLEKVAAHINKNINSKLNVDQLADLMNMSRPTFYRKIKTISNLSPLDLIRITRLKRSAELLAEGVYSIQQIASMTGFGSQAHFGKCFIKQFGIAPLEYSNSTKNTTKPLS